MTMKRYNSILWVAAALLGIVSCARMELAPAGNAADGVVVNLTAEWADAGMTKTAIQEDGTSVWWTASESINVFSDLTESNGVMFTSTNAEPSATVTFSGTLPVSTGSPELWAVYPYSSSNSFDGERIRLTVPMSQTASAGTFGDKLFPAIARTTGSSLSFYNVCGGAVFTVATEGVRAVTFVARGGESLAGQVNVGFDSEERPCVESMQYGNDRVVVTPAGGGHFEVGKKYYAVFLPGTLSHGLSVTFQTDYQIATASVDREIVVKRSLFGRLFNLDEGLEFEVDAVKIAADYASLYDTFAQKVASHGSASMFVPTRALFNLGGDDVYAAGASFGDNDMLGSFNEFRYDYENQVVRYAFTNYYSAINEFNRLISIYDSLDLDVPKKLVAEARVLRAYLYFLLAAGWGNPPFVDVYHPWNQLPYDLNGDPDRQMSQTEFFAWCASECEAVLESLDERESTADEQGAYKVTKGFANAVAGKAYLFAGRYSEAQTALQQVIDSHKYALVPGERYWENFHIEGDGNEEKVFESDLHYDPAVGLWSGPIQRSTWMEANLWNWRSDHFVAGASPQDKYTGGVAGWGGLGVPQWFGDEFFENDASSYRFEATLKRIDDAVYGMEYNDEAINALTLEQKKASSAIGISVQSGIYGQSFYLPFKQLLRSTDTGSYGNNVRLNNYTIMRYAEVLLLYAEACLQTGDQDKAKQVINQIQERAGSRTVSASVDMNVLKKEKSYELWLEGSRWLDLLRWGDTDRVKQAGQAVPVLFDKVYRAPQPGETVVWEHGSEADSRFYTITTHKAIDAGMTVGFVPGKHEHFPYPYDAIRQYPSLVQNPGW